MTRAYKTKDDKIKLICDCGWKSRKFGTERTLKKYVYQYYNDNAEICRDSRQD